MNLYPWLQPIYQQITTIFADKRGYHSLLFNSEAGLGTPHLIKQLAHWLLCQSVTAKQAVQPCGECHSCHLYLSGNHTDFYFVSAEQNKEIGVDSVRVVIEKLYQHAQQGGNKVVYIDGVQRLTETAANALLKTLEEPRENCYFLLESNLAKPILPTIYSRSQVWTITAPSLESGNAWLKTQLNASEVHFSDEQLCTALRVNYNRPLFALDFLQKGLLEKRQQFLRQFWLFAQRKDIMQLLPHFETEFVMLQLDWIESFISDAIKASLAIKQGWICQDIANGVIKFSQLNHRLNLLKAAHIIQEIRENLQITAVNQELILINGLTQLILDVFEVK